MFRSTAASEYEADWGGDVRVLSTNVQQAKDMFKSIMDGYQRDLSSDDIVLVLSGSNNFRYELTETYKSNRKGSRKPLGYREVESWLYEEYPGRVVAKDCLEADDYLGILATKPNGPERIIVSDDKDLKTIPGKLYRLGALSEISEDEADEWWFTQVLTGDPTDGYKGCPGIGAVKAKSILSKPGSIYENVKAAYLRAGQTENDCLLQCRIARILRYSDWDAKAQRPILWQPPVTG